MSVNIITRKTRLIADRMARDAIGSDHIRPEDRKAFVSEYRQALRYLTGGHVYYTASDFPAF